MSTDLAVQTPAVLIEPRTGEILEVTPDNAITVLVACREQTQLVKEARAMATAVILEEARRQGAKTFHVGGFKAQVKEGTEIVWDVSLLRELLELGLPAERWADLVTETVEYRVSAVVAKQLAANNDAYARVIEAARKTFDKSPYVSVSGA